MGDRATTAVPDNALEAPSASPALRTIWPPQEENAGEELPLVDSLSDEPAPDETVIRAAVPDSAAAVSSLRPPLMVGSEVVAALKGRPTVLGSRSVPASLSRPAPTTSRAPAASPLGLLQPVLWLNRTFDRGTTWLGAPGRWLRSPKGRAILGWLGMALLAAAVAWQIILWISWTP